MKRIDDKIKIEKWVKENQIRSYFDTPDLEFEAFEFEKGELVTSPIEKNDRLLFLVKGTARVIGILEDGRIIPINYVEKPAMLGDLEFMKEGVSFFYCEAVTSIVCIALSVSRYRSQLERDVRFLHRLLRSYAEKLSLFAHMSAGAPLLEERVLNYMKNMSPNGELRGMDACALKLRCSRRQLQRVLKQLCEKGAVCKAGKGLYKLCE